MIICCWQRYLGITVQITAVLIRPLICALYTRALQRYLSLTTLHTRAFACTQGPLPTGPCT